MSETQVLIQQSAEAPVAEGHVGIAPGSWDDLLANWPVMLAVAGLCLLSRYWLSAHFGIYEDDYIFVPSSLETPLTRVPAAFWEQMKQFHQGRPLGWGFWGLLATIAGKIDGLHGIYWLGYGIAVLNVLLLFTLLRRAGAGQAFSAAAAAAFAVYPADVSQAFLTHSLGVHPAMTLVLVAMHLWLKGQRLGPWALVCAALFWYETPVPLFAAVPLLLPRWNWRQILGHASILAVGVAAVAFLRKHFGEGRMSDLNLLSASQSALHNVSMGPFVSLTSYVWRPFEMARGFDTTARVLGLVAALIGLVLFLWYDAAASEELVRLAIAGVVCLFISYTLPIILDAMSSDGRASRVHYAASIGCAILVACMFACLTKRYGRFVAAAAMALILGTSTAAGVAVQRDYQRSWDLQRKFWQDVVRLCPDLVLGKVVLVDGFRNLPEAQHLQVFEWYTPMVLTHIYQFPAGDSPAPRLFLMKPDWRNYLEPDGSLVIGERTVVWPFFWETPQKFGASDLIVLEVRDGKLVRDGQPGPPVHLPEGVLHSYLLGP